MAELSRKKRIRSAQRRVTRQLCMSVDELLSSSTCELSKLESLEKSLDSKKIILGTLDDDLLSLIDEENIDEDVVKSTNIQMEIDECLIKIRNNSAKCASPSVVDMERDMVESEPEDMVATPYRRHFSNQAKLPKLELKKFSGDAMQWIAFKESFNSAVDTNTGLSDIDKFNYLRTLLTGTAAETIAGLPLSGSNYREAVKLLEERFGNKQVIVSAHMDSLLKIQAVSSIHDTKGLRIIHDRVESNIRSLSGLGQS